MEENFYGMLEVGRIASFPCIPFILLCFLQKTSSCLVIACTLIEIFIDVSNFLFLLKLCAFYLGDFTEYTPETSKISCFNNLGAILWIWWSIWLKGNKWFFSNIVDSSIGVVMKAEANAIFQAVSHREFFWYFCFRFMEQLEGVNWAFFSVLIIIFLFSLLHVCFFNIINQLPLKKSCINMHI